MSRIAENVFLALSAMAAALVVAAVSTDGSAAATSPEELPANTVAVVSHVPAGLGTITKAELRRGLAQSVASGGRKSLPEPGGKAYERIENVALGERLDLVWVRGQAAEMGITITPRRVARELAQLKKQAFESEAEYRRFLREARFTRREVHERIKVQMLAEAIQRRVMRGAAGEAERQDAIRKFIDVYEARWRARTVCAPQHITDRCSNDPRSVAGQIE
jgi:hypothetical protein